MTDLLIRDVPAHVVAAIDAKARGLGISRTEYVRRQLTQTAMGSAEPVSAEDLRRFSEAFADLGDPQVMAGAWRQTAG